MKLAPCIIIGALALGGIARGAEPWTLEAALQQALKRNPDARLAQHRIAAAEAVLQQAQSAFWPKLQFQSSYARTDNPMHVFGSILNQQAFTPLLNFNDVPDTDNLNVKGLVTVPLYTGGAITSARRAARALEAGAELEAAAVRNQLAFEVARAYYTVLKTKEFIRATEAGVRAFEQNLEVARKRLDAGTLLKSDVLDVEVRLAQAREDLVQAQNAHRLAMRALRNLLGIEQGEGDLEVVEAVPEVSVPKERDFTRRPELQAALQRARAAEAKVREAQAGYLPRLSAFGSVDYDYGWRFESGAPSYSGGVMVEWSLWDGNLTRARVREARAALEAAREQSRKIRLAIDLEVEQALIRLREANERLAVTETMVAQADESAQLTRRRFEQGLAISTQLIDAEAALIGARVRRAEAEANRRIAVAALRKALGLPQLDSPSSNP